MLLAFGIVLFTIAVYMGLDAVTVRQKQVAGSLARARRYGGGTLRETELTKDVTNRLIAPTARKLADLATALPMTQNPDEIRRRLSLRGSAIASPDARSSPSKAPTSSARCSWASCSPAPASCPLATALASSASLARFPALAFLLPDFVLGPALCACAHQHRPRSSCPSVHLPGAFSWLRWAFGFDAHWPASRSAARAAARGALDRAARDAHRREPHSRRSRTSPSAL